MARLGAICAGVIAIATRYFATFLLTTAAGTLVKDFYGYSSKWALLPSISIFAVAKHVRVSIHCQKVLSRMSVCSYGVYLIHLVVIKLFANCTNTDGTALIYRTIGPYVVYALYVVIVYALRRSSLLKRAIP